MITTRVSKKYKSSQQYEIKTQLDINISTCHRRSNMFRCLFLTFITLVCTAHAVPGTLFVDNGGPWGSWGVIDYCSKGSYAVGYKMKVIFFSVQLPFTLFDAQLQKIALKENIITKTCLHTFDPLKPHCYIVKLRFTRVYIIFLFCSKI